MLFSPSLKLIVGNVVGSRLGSVVIVALGLIVGNFVIILDGV